jgi:hypothetical protein
MESAVGVQTREYSVLASEIDARTQGVLIRKKFRNIRMHGVCNAAQQRLT